MFRKDFHLHTWRCKHATGDVPELVARADALGLEAVGISDHMPYPDDRWTQWRIDYGQLDELIGLVRAARDRKGCRVYAGLECEWHPDFRAYYEDELLGSRGLDYLIGSTHFTPVGGHWLSSFDALTEPKHLRAYVAHTVALIDTGLFAFVGHPDVFAQCFPRWTPDVAAASKDLVQAAADRGAVLELNASGYRKPWTRADADQSHPYPWRNFWELAAESGVNVVVNSDAHAVADLYAEVPRAYALAAELGLSLVDIETRIVK